MKESPNSFLKLEKLPPLNNLLRLSKLGWIVNKILLLLSMCITSLNGLNCQEKISSCLPRERRVNRVSNRTNKKEDNRRKEKIRKKKNKGELKKIIKRKSIIKLKYLNPMFKSKHRHKSNRLNKKIMKNQRNSKKKAKNLKWDKNKPRTTKRAEKEEKAVRIKIRKISVSNVKI